MRKLIAFYLLVTCSIITQAQPTKIVADKIIAVVGDKIILQSDIENIISDAKRQGIDLSENDECMVIDQVLALKILTLQAEKDSLPVTNEEVEIRLNRMMQAFVMNALSELGIETIHQLKEGAREQVRARMLAEAMQEKIVNQVKVTPSEVQAFFDRIPVDSLPFFESELEIGQVIIYPKATGEMEKYTVAELNNYKKQVETKLVAFEKLAQLYSQDRNYHYMISRNDKSWSPAFLSATFRLKEGEISAPVRSGAGYYLIKLIERRGDEADVQVVVKVPPVTDVDVNGVIAKLDTVRSALIAGKIGFSEAVSAYSNDEASKFSAFILNRDGSSYVTIDQLDRETVAAISKIGVGDYSQPVSFTNEQGRRGVKLIYLKSRTQPHRMNMRDDYSRISQLALTQKRTEALNKWYNAHISSCYIEIDTDAIAKCEEMKKYLGEDPQK